MVLDPGGHKVYPKLFSLLSTIVKTSELKHLFFSHQDPDIVAAMNGWLMVTEAQAYLPGLWTRFVVHFGIDEAAFGRITPIPDEGMSIQLGGAPLKFLPAHYLHSPGNFQVYDPIAKILYSGDLGASVGSSYPMVENFETHLQYIEPFHKRYMSSSKAFKMWANTVRTLDIDIIAPQHGAVYPNKEMVKKFIDWIDTLSCGAELMGDSFNIPA